MVLETGARWVYLPRLFLSGKDLAAATREMRDRWLREIFAALGRARVGYILLTYEDWVENPAIRPLFGPIGSLPVEVQLLGDIRRSNPWAPAQARIFRFLGDGQNQTHSSP